MGDIQLIQSANCCETTQKTILEGCANNVPYRVIMCTGDCGDAVTLSYINLLTGVQTSVAPVGFQAYNCDAVPQYTQKCVPYLETETFDATAGQTFFTIAHEASGDVRFSRNGATLHDAAAIVSGNLVTYVPGPNNAEVLLANDRIEISYLYVVCEDSVPVDYVLKDCSGNELPSGTEFVTCDSLDPNYFTVQPNGQIKPTNAGQALEDCLGNVLPNGTNVVKCDALDPNYFTIQPNGSIRPTSTGQALEDCLGNVLPNGTAVLKCDALNPDQFEIDPATGEISSKCCDKDQITCYARAAVTETTIASTVTPFNSKVAQTGAGGGPEVVNFTYTTGNEIDGQYSLRDGTNNHTAGGGYGIAFNIGLGVTTPLLLYRQTFSGLTPGDVLKLSTWVKSRAGDSNFQYKIYNSATGALLSTYTPGIYSVSQGWVNHKGGDFVVPAGGSVRLEITTLLTGQAAGNDPLLDDISLVKAGQTGACYKKIVSNGVETWYDGAGIEITNQATINSIKAEITSGVTDITDCSSCYGGSKIVAGTGINVTGSGTVADPYVISLA